LALIHPSLPTLSDEDPILRAFDTAAVPHILSDTHLVEKGLFVDNGRQIATIDSKGYLRVLSADDLALISISEAPMILEEFSTGGSVDKIELLDGLETIAVGTSSGSFQLWDAVQSRPRSQVMMLGGALNDFRWLPEQKLLVTSFDIGWPDSVCVWDLESGKWQGGSIEFRACLAMSPDGRWILELTDRSDLQIVRVWDVIENRALSPPLRLPFPLPTTGTERSPLAGFSSDSQYVYVRGESSITVFPIARIDSSSVIDSEFLSSENVISVQFVDAGKGVLVASNDGFGLYDSMTGDARFPDISLKDLNLVRVSPDSSQLVTVKQMDEAFTSVEAWDLKTGNSSGLAYRHRGEVDSLYVSNDGQRCLAVGPEEVVLWDIREQVVLFRYGFPNLRFSNRSSNLLEKPTAILSPDGNSVLMLHESLSRPLALWQFPGLQKPMSSLVYDLAEAVGQYRLDSDGGLQAVGTYRLLEIQDRLRSEGDASLFPAPMGWFLDDPMTRTVSPYSQVHQSDYLNRLSKTKTLSGLIEVLRLAPEHELANQELKKIVNFRAEKPKVNEAALLELAGKLLAAFNAVIGDYSYSNERRVQTAELLSRYSSFGEIEIIRSRSSTGGWERLLREWIDGGPSSRWPIVSFTGEQLARVGNLSHAAVYSKRRARAWWELGKDELQNEIERLQGVLLEVGESLGRVPTTSKASESHWESASPPVSLQPLSPDLR